MSKLTVIHGDCLTELAKLPGESVQCCVTSPPYWGLRDYGHPGQLGLEPTPEAYVETMVRVFREVRRVLKADGTCWINLGDSYARDPGKGGSGPNGKHDFIPDYGNARKIMSESKGSSDGFVGRGDRAAVRVGGSGLKPKDLVGIPWAVAFALRADGWYLRSDIIWSKPNPMPESVTDRPTKAHEYIFLLTKSERYYYDHEAIKEPVVKGAAGSLFHTGKTGEHQLGRASTKPRKSDMVGTNGRNIQMAGSETERRDQIGSFNNNPRLRPDDGRNKRSVWTVTTKPFKGAHFATYPPELITPCILAGSRIGDMVLDPFGGSGTSAEVALGLSRDCTLIELNGEYLPLIAERTGTSAGHLALHT